MSLIKSMLFMIAGVAAYAINALFLIKSMSVMIASVAAYTVDASFLKDIPDKISGCDDCRCCRIHRIA
jgi:hypothetical protein